MTPKLTFSISVSAPCDLGVSSALLQQDTAPNPTQTDNSVQDLPSDPVDLANIETSTSLNSTLAVEPNDIFVEETPKIFPLETQAPTSQKHWGVFTHTNLVLEAQCL